ncbi:hypothetical protein Tco_0503211 [Tanacetum coccineum]
MALESGKLNHLIKDVRQRGWGNAKGRDAGKDKIINMIRSWPDDKKRKSVEKDEKLESRNEVAVEEHIDGSSSFRRGSGEAVGLELERLEKKQMIEKGASQKTLQEEEGPEIVDLTEHTLINPAYPDQLVTIGGNLSEECKSQLRILLKKSMDVFAWELTDMIGVPKRIIEHSLNVNPSIEPVAQNRRVLASDRTQVVIKEVEEWVNAGIIRSVKYPTWIANPVLVKKADGSWRMCIDFKNLNLACPKDYYPFLDIDGKIKSVVGFRYKCFLDAYKGYHQVQMAQDDEEKTTFYTDRGMYCYTKMPFGLKNTGATY